MPHNPQSAGYVLLAIVSGLILTLVVISPGKSQAFNELSPQSSNGKLAFANSGFIYTVNIDGSGQQQVTSNGTNQTPAWSPDGNRIALSRRGPQDTTSAIYVMNPDGTGLQQISVNPLSDTQPTWSPDGSKIAFIGFIGNNPEVFVMNADGSNRINLTNNPEPDFFPAWSPDGSRIAFVSSRDFPGITGDVTRGYEIYVMNADGSNPTRLTNNTFGDTHPSWSADSSKLTFDTNRDGNVEIYSMNGDGSSQTNISNHPSSDFDPIWSPDGNRIAFLSFRDGLSNQEIYRMDSNGSNQTRVTTSSFGEVDLAWQPLSGAPTPTPTPTPSPSPSPSPLLVISQVYGGGGTPGATYQASFVELFNRGTTSVDLNHWSLRFASSATGTFDIGVTFVSSGSIPIQPGQYVLLKIGVNGASGSPIAEDFGAFNNPLELSGKIALIKPNGSIPTGPCPLPDSDVADFVGYGSAANCFEGSGPTGNLSNTTAAVRKLDGCLDTNNNSSDFPIVTPTPRNRSSPLHVCSNPIDDAEFFVRQHYSDFLSRQPDPSGLSFWVDQITSCGTDQTCIEIKRINVSAAFFLSIEFQETGYLVERLFKSSYGDTMGTSTIGGTFHQLFVPIVRFNELLPDTQQIGQGVVVGQAGWEQVLENNKQTFIDQFVQRSRFTTAFPLSMTAAQFVDALNTNAGGVLSQAERNQLVMDLDSGARTRAQVLRAVAEDPDLANAERNRAFVLMQYFGYLRRNPNDPPDSDYSGYDFWLTKLNQFNGNFVNAEMVKAFIISGEYRQRF